MFICFSRVSVSEFIKKMSGLMKRLSKQQITMQQTNAKKYRYVFYYQ